MNLNQLYYALEINRLGSFSRAAQTLYISQSALSKSIHTLEEELEQEIFLRTMDGITATDFGRAFLTEAEAVMRHTNKIKELAAHAKEQEKEPDRFSASCGQMMFASEIFARMLATHVGEKADFQFAQKSYSEVFLDVKEGRSDFGLLTTMSIYTEEALALFKENGMEYQTLGRLNMGIAVDRGNPIAEPGVSRVSRSQLKNQALVMVRETIYPFTREAEELKVAFDDPGIIYVGDNDTAFSLCKQIPAYMCVAQNTGIYRKLNIPVSMVIYPCQNLLSKYEFGWIRKRDTALSRMERNFLEEIGKLFH